MLNAKAQESQGLMPAFVEAPVNYLADLSVTPVTYNPPAGTGVPRRVGNYQNFKVDVQDGRTLAPSMSLDKQAFKLVNHDTQVRDFYDTEEVKTRYYAEVEALTQTVRAQDRGYELGVATVINVLDARRRLLRSRVDQSKARYDYLRDLIGLKMRAGMLAEADVAEFNRWLGPRDE